MLEAIAHSSGCAIGESESTHAKTHSTTQLFEETLPSTLNLNLKRQEYDSSQMEEDQAGEINIRKPALQNPRRRHRRMKNSLNHSLNRGENNSSFVTNRSELNSSLNHSYSLVSGFLDWNHDDDDQSTTVHESQDPKPIDTHTTDSEVTRSNEKQRQDSDTTEEEVVDDRRESWHIEDYDFDPNPNPSPFRLFRKMSLETKTITSIISKLSHGERGGNDPSTLPLSQEAITTEQVKSALLDITSKSPGPPDHRRSTM